MNTKDKKISNAASDRRTYLSPRTEIIKIATSNLIMESIGIAVDDPGATDANGKQWQGDFDSWDEEEGSNEKDRGSVW